MHSFVNVSKLEDGRERRDVASYKYSLLPRSLLFYPSTLIEAKEEGNYVY
jgi:hypothetical protein